MAVVALGSMRSCGVSTAALALSLSWPKDRRVVLVEVDPAGGTLAASLGLAPEPGLVSLAAATRRPLEASTDPALALGHAQALTSEASMVVSPPSAERARHACALLEPMLARLGELDIDVLLDCGRLEPGSPARTLFCASAVPILLARAQLADLHTAASSLDQIASERTALILVGEGSYPAAEVATALEREVLATLPWDPAGASRLGAGSRPERIGRTALVRSATTLSHLLTERLDGCERETVLGPVPSWNGNR